MSNIAIIRMNLSVTAKYSYGLLRIDNLMSQVVRPLLIGLKFTCIVGISPGFTTNFIVRVLILSVNI